jgi:hypothetical protein
MTPPTHPNPSVTASGPASVGVGRDNYGPITTNYFAEGLPPERRLHNLPSPLPEKKFVGRAGEKANIRRILRAANNGNVALLALWGMGGVGKTSLALSVADELTDQFPEAQLHYKLHGTSNAPASSEKILEDVIRRFGAGSTKVPDDPESLQRDYLSCLTGKRVLLVLDNARDATQVRPLIPPKGCGLIITSRQSLHSLTEVKSIALDLLPESDSVKLLRVRTGISGARDEKRGTKDDFKTVARLCGYLPLALDVAGGFLDTFREWSLTQYIEELGRWRLEYLKSGNDKTKDVEAVLGFSAARLVEENRELAAHWQELSILRQDFEERVAAAVLNFGTDSLRAKSLLSTLRERSLILFDMNNQRYRLHELIQEVAAKVFEYGEDKSLAATSAERLAAARWRFTAYSADLIMRLNDGLATDDTTTQRQFLKALQSELQNLPTIFNALIADVQSGVPLDPNKLYTAIGSLQFVETSLELVFGSKDLMARARKQFDQLQLAEFCWYVAHFEATLMGNLVLARKWARRALLRFNTHSDRRAREVRSAVANWRSGAPRPEGLDRMVRAAVRRLSEEQIKAGPPSPEAS